MKPDKPHNSMRGYFAWYLYDEMKANKDIILIVIDLGYGMFDAIRDDIPDQFINTGASEQAAMGIAVGLAMSGKIPVVYSITPFLLWRPAETIRLYLDHENIPVKLVGSGRDTDYEHDGFSHDATDTKKLVNQWKSIHQYWPNSEISDTLASLEFLNDGRHTDIDKQIHEMLYNNKPSFMSLKRTW